MVQIATYLVKNYKDLAYQYRDTNGNLNNPLVYLNL